MKTENYELRARLAKAVSTLEKRINAHSKLQLLLIDMLTDKISGDLAPYAREKIYSLLSALAVNIYEDQRALFNLPPKDRVGDSGDFMVTDEGGHAALGE